MNDVQCKAYEIDEKKVWQRAIQLSSSTNYNCNFLFSNHWRWDRPGVYLKSCNSMLINLCSVLIMLKSNTSCNSPLPSGRAPSSVVRALDGPASESLLAMDQLLNYVLRFLILNRRRRRRNHSLLQQTIYYWEGGSQTLAWSNQELTLCLSYI